MNSKQDSMTIRDAARALTIDRRTLRRIIREGRCKTVGVLTNRQRVPKAEVERLLAEVAAGRTL